MRRDKTIIVSITKYGGIATLTILTFVLFINYPKYLTSFSYSMTRFLAMSLGFIGLFFLKDKIQLSWMKTWAILIFLIGLMYYPYTEQKLMGQI